MTQEPDNAVRSVDLASFSLGDMLRCGPAIRDAAAGAQSMEAAADAIVRHFATLFRDPATDAPQCALVRFFKTHPYRTLEPPLQEVARTFMSTMGDGTLEPETKCLTLLATAGQRPEWDDRHRSRAHRTIPLPSAKVVERAPMIAQLIRQLGIDVSTVLGAPHELLRMESRTYNVFYVDQAAGSEFIPAQQEFVIPYGIKSVVGFGGLIGEELFAVILFATVSIPPESAERFRALALDVKRAVYRIPESRVFASDASASDDGAAADDAAADDAS